MPKNRGRGGAIIRHYNARRGVPTSLHGRLAIELGSIPYSGPSPLSRFSQSSTPSSSNPSSSTPSSSRQSIASQSIHHPPIQFLILELVNKLRTVTTSFLHCLHYHTSMYLPHLLILSLVYKYRLLLLQQSNLSLIPFSLPNPHILPQCNFPLLHQSRFLLNQCRCQCNSPLLC